MKKISLLITFGLYILFSEKCLAQSNIYLQLGHKDFGIWAFQKHNEVCKTIYEQIKSGSLATYNAKNLKETRKETLSKLGINKMVVFIQDNPDDPVTGHDSSLYTDKTENYYLFKVSSEFILMKPDKNNTGLLKFKKSELLAVLNTEMKDYFNTYTSGFSLCIDSIPVISKRIFMQYNSRLFDYSKRPDVKLYLTDSLNKVLTLEEKIYLSMDQYTAFLSTDPNDPTVGFDTVILSDYNIRDTAKEHKLIFMATLKDYKINVHTISCGLERSSVGFSAFTVPFGHLPFNENGAYTPAEMTMLNAILQIKMSDDLGIHQNNEDAYDDYFGDDE